jgi:putative Holliday junction resolvase
VTAPGSHGRILALDLGSRTIGLAVSDETRTISQPLRTLERQADGYRRNLAELRGIVRDMDVALVVVGLPLRLDGKPGVQARKATAFADLLRDRLGVPVALYDERLTTFEAEEALAQYRLDQRERKRRVDAVAASLILRGYLEAAQATHA